MLFRQFVEQIKDSGEAMVRLVHGGRDVTPFFYMDTATTGVEGLPLDPAFFESQQARDGMLVAITAIIKMRRPEHVAWVFTGEALTDDGAGHVLVVIALDRERDELWHSRLYRRDDGAPIVGGWQAVENEGAGFLVTPIQEALR